MLFLKSLNLCCNTNEGFLWDFIVHITAGNVEFHRSGSELTVSRREATLKGRMRPALPRRRVESAEGFPTVRARCRGRDRPGSPRSPERPRVEFSGGWLEPVGGGAGRGREPLAHGPQGRLGSQGRGVESGGWWQPPRWKEGCGGLGLAATAKTWAERPPVPRI